MDLAARGSRSSAVRISQLGLKRGFSLGWGSKSIPELYFRPEIGKIAFFDEKSMRGASGLIFSIVLDPKTSEFIGSESNFIGFWSS